MKKDDTISNVIVSPSEFPGSSVDTYNFLELIDQFLFEGFKVLLICPKRGKNDNAYFGEYNPNLEILRINCKLPRLNELDNGIKVINYFKFILFLFLEIITVVRIPKTRKVKKLYIRHSILTMQLPLFLKLIGTTTLVDGEIVSDTMKHLLPLIFLKLFSAYEKKIIKFYSYFKVSSIFQVPNLEAIGYL
jgi:hypothetical protein